MRRIEIFQYLSLVRYRGLTSIFKRFNDLDISVILDLEDSAQDLFSKKNTELLKKACRKGLVYISKIKIKPSIFLRINETKSSFFKKDIISVKESINNGMKLKGIFLPKVEDYKSISNVYELINGKKHNIKIVPIIETKKGYKNLEYILKEDKNNNIISAVHYGHFDFCLDNRIWPFSEPYHKEYWELVFPLIKLVIKYQKKFVHTPFPLIQNPYLFWSSANYILKKFKQVKLSMSLVNYDLRFIHRPKSIKSLRLKKMSNNKNYKIKFAKKIINSYLESKSQKKSFSLSNKRFIPPHQYLGAKYFLKQNDK